MEVFRSSISLHPRDQVDTLATHLPLYNMEVRAFVTPRACHYSQRGDKVCDNVLIAELIM